MSNLLGINLSKQALSGGIFGGTMNNSGNVKTNPNNQPTQAPKQSSKQKFLKSLVPGVVAKDYEVESLNIYNLILFLAGKQVNGALGEDVINYGEIFKHGPYVKISKNTNKGMIIESLCCGFSTEELKFNLAFENHPPIPAGPLHNVEEVAKYMEDITCNVIAGYGQRINDITKKATRQMPESKSVGDDNLRGIIYNAATDARLYNTNLYLKYVAPQLLENQVNKTLIITMWREAVETIYHSFVDMVMSAALGKPEDPEKEAEVLVGDAAVILLENAITVTNKVMGANIQYNNPTVTVSQPVALEVQDMDSIDEALKKELIIMHKSQRNNEESSIEHSAIEEMIIQKIIQEKMQEREISVG